MPKVNLDHPTTRFTLYRLAVALMVSTRTPLDRILVGLHKLEGMPPGDGFPYTASVEFAHLHVAWDEPDERGVPLLAAREYQSDASVDAEFAFHDVDQPVWTSIPLGTGGAAALESWAKVRRLLRESPEQEASVPDRIRLDDGSWAALLVRPGPCVLVLAVGPGPDHIGLEDEARALITELDRLLDLAVAVGVGPTHRLYRETIVEARRRGMTPAQFLRRELGEPAAWALTIAERYDDDIVRRVLALHRADLQELRNAQAENEALNTRVVQLLRELDG